jgi:hypothetical protein
VNTAILDPSPSRRETDLPRMRELLERRDLELAPSG